MYTFFFYGIRLWRKIKRIYRKTDMKVNWKIKQYTYRVCFWQVVALCIFIVLQKTTIGNFWKTIILHSYPMSLCLQYLSISLSGLRNFYFFNLCCLWVKPIITTANGMHPMLAGSHPKCFANNSIVIDLARCLPSCIPT